MPGLMEGTRPTQLGVTGSRFFSISMPSLGRGGGDTLGVDMVAPLIAHCYIKLSCSGPMDSIHARGYEEFSEQYTRAKDTVRTLPDLRNVSLGSDSIPDFILFVYVRGRRSGGLVCLWRRSLQSYFFRTAVHLPSARPSIFILPFAESPSIHPASVAVTAPGCWGQVPLKVSST